MNDISNNAADFSKALMALADHVDGTFERVVRKACIDLYRAIVEKTPVDTGRAKASWGLSTSHAEDVKEGWPGLSESEILSKVSEVMGENVSDFKFDIHDDEVIIYNNLDYIEYLEDGTSQQAPNGMVSTSLAEFTIFFNNALQGLGGVS